MGMYGQDTVNERWSQPKLSGLGLLAWLASMAVLFSQCYGRDVGNVGCFGAAERRWNPRLRKFDISMRFFMEWVKMGRMLATRPQILLASQ